MVIENSSLLTVSETAAGKFREVLAEQEDQGALVRISLAPGPNGGVEYVLGLEDAPGESDTVVDVSGVKIVVDAESSPLIEGASIDYVEGLQRTGFVISNPNFASGCACGGGGGGCGGGGGHGHGGGGGCGCGGDGGGDGGGHGGGGGCACGGH